jgi:hypothetical protein
MMMTMMMLPVVDGFGWMKLTVYMYAEKNFIDFCWKKRGTHTLSL